MSVVLSDLIVMKTSFKAAAVLWALPGLF